MVVKTFKLYVLYRLVEKKEEAINYYKLGIDEFMKGLDIRLDDDDQSRLAHIQEKMESNMMMALERVNVLSKLVEI